MHPRFLVRLALALCCSGCADRQPETLSAEPSAEVPAEQAQGRADLPLIAFLGDSLTAGNGLAEGEAYPALIQARLARDGRAVRIVNAGVSGDTSAGGLARLGWMLQQAPDIVVVALGANDGLRGLPVSELERNLTAIVTRSRESGARVLLVGMLVPPNYGEDYTRGFAALFPALAEKHGVPFMPFLLEGVAAVPALNQPDGIHPNPDGVEAIVRRILPSVEAALDRAD